MRKEFFLRALDVINTLFMLSIMITVLILALRDKDILFIFIGIMGILLLGISLCKKRKSISTKLIKKKFLVIGFVFLMIYFICIPFNIISILVGIDILLLLSTELLRTFLIRG